MSLRTFVAIDLTPTVIKKIIDFQKELGGQIPPIIRWTKKEQIHITLKFIGALKEDQLDSLNTSLIDTVSSMNRFSLSFENAGIFPNMNNPRILWIGIKSSPELFELVSTLETIFDHYGYAPEKRPFQAHITIGRFKDHITRQDLAFFQNVFHSHHPIFHCNQIVDQLTFYKSTLTPHSPIYEPLTQIRLQ